MTSTQLRKRLLAAYAVTAPALCLLLFIPAGTMAYWQAWLYIILFLSLGLIESLILLHRAPKLLASRLTLTPLAEPAMDQKIIQCANSVLFVALLIACGLDVKAHGARMPASASLATNAAMASGPCT